MKTMTQDDSREKLLAAAAHLIYVNDAQPGLTRVRKGQSFQYYNAAGLLVRSSRQLRRIQKLSIPPAWSNVWICRSDRGHLQCTGCDSRHRKQYLYHARWREIANAAKFSNLPGFGEALPRIRRRIARDLRVQEWTKDKLAAVAVRLLDRSALRVGNREYTRDNASYGLTTLEPRHVTITGNEVRLEFIGKSGQTQVLAFRDRSLIPLLKALLACGSPTLLSYRKDDKLLTLTAGDVNDYLHRISKGSWTAKDFRTWQASVIAAECLAKQSEDRPQRRAVLLALRTAAERLGNTVTVCRKYYVFPKLIQSFEQGRLDSILKTFTTAKRTGYSLSEQRFLWILRALSTR